MYDDSFFVVFIISIVEDLDRIYQKNVIYGIFDY